MSGSVGGRPERRTARSETGLSGGRRGLSGGLFSARLLRWRYWDVTTPANSPSATTMRRGSPAATAWVEVTIWLVG